MATGGETTPQAAPPLGTIPIDRDRLIAAFKHAGIGAGCTACGSTDWEVFQTAAGLPQWRNLIGPALVGIPVVVMMCGRCGLIRMHALSKLGLLPASLSPQGP